MVIRFKGLKIQRLLLYKTIFGGVGVILTALFAPLVFAGPSSNNYQLIDYGMSSGTASSSSTQYSLFGSAGQVDQGSPSSSNYFIGAGLEYTIQASVAAAPTFTNPSNWYSKLNLTINRGGNDPSDYKYAIAIASGSGQFQYVQNDNTVGDDLGLEDWQTYSAWGGASGFTIIGLYPGTIYTAKVASKQGDFYTQFLWGPTSQATTSNPTLSFALDTTGQVSPPFSINIGQLTAGSVTTSSDQATATVSTNATGGVTVYVYGSNTGLVSSQKSYTITSSSNNLSSLTEGYGIRGTSVNQTSGGPMQILSPYNGAANNVGVASTTQKPIFDSSSLPVTNGEGSFELKAKASSTTPSASDYTDILTIIAAGSF